MPHSSLITWARGGYESFRILVCDILYIYRLFGITGCLHVQYIKLEYSRNVDTYVPDYTALNPTII